MHADWEKCVRYGCTYSEDVFPCSRSVLLNFLYNFFLRAKWDFNKKKFSNFFFLEIKGFDLSLRTFKFVISIMHAHLAIHRLRSEQGNSWRKVFKSIFFFDWINQLVLWQSQKLIIIMQQWQTTKLNASLRQAISMRHYCVWARFSNPFFII